MEECRVHETNAHEICFEKRGGDPPWTICFRNKSCCLCWVGQLCSVGLEMLRIEVSCPCHLQATKIRTFLPSQSHPLTFHKMKIYRYSQTCKPPLRSHIRWVTHVNHWQNTSRDPNFISTATCFSSWILSFLLSPEHY